MNEVIESFQRLIPSRSKKGGRGWVTFNCPACGDRRGRGGYLETSTGGFRYRCMNGGCRFESNTGWEPDNGFMGRPRRLFELMGGDISDIPKALLDGPSARRTTTHDMTDPDGRQAWIEQMLSDWSPEAASTKLWSPKSDDEVSVNFPILNGMPKGTEFLWHASTADALDVQNYVLKRGRFFRDSDYINTYNPLLWCPKYKRHVIIPFLDKNRNFIGWIARKIDSGKEYAHIKCPKFPSDYMLNQNLRFSYSKVLITQGAFDAMALRGLCTFGSVVSKKQINLLNQLKEAGKTIVLVPDFKKDEWHDYLRTAREQGWSLSIPDTFGGDGTSPEDYIKDPGDAIKLHGLFHTIETIMNAITNNYMTAEAVLSMRSR